ncbi:hypothetical protein [Taklimakanibacter deserti]|uniref:hypothetical protein n=1 Tax=Taklimakanibacter deserti TaxID=2267839 RepID=UPI000E64B8A4
MTFRSLVSSLILSAALATSAHAASQKETSKDWTASLDEVNTGEDLRKTCSAWTTAKDAAGKDWTLKLAISNGDVLPPDGYPAIVVGSAAGGLPKGENQPASFDFGDKKLEAKVSGDGKEAMINNVKATSLALLKGLAAGSAVTVTLAGKPTPSLSLAGFTASYRKLGQWCGFQTSDVAK